MIRVIIERFIAETLEANYEHAAKTVLQTAITAPGFISGESLVDVHNPRHRVILCKFRSRLDWEKWETSIERKRMMDQINPMLEKEETVTVMEHA